MTINGTPPTHLSIFGQRIIGKDAATYFENPQSTQATVFGSRVVGAGVPAAPPPTPADTNKDGLVSVAEMRDALQADPSRLDEFIAAEAARTPPRKGAVRLLRDAEAAKPEGEQRAQVLADLDQLLATLAAG